jgi:pyocin large subunit-like protein
MMFKTLSCAGLTALLAGAAITLGACDGGAASTAARDHTAAASTDTTVATADSRDDLNGDHGGARGDDQAEAPRAPVPLVDGKPMWAANRRHSAEENANYQFQRDGADFGARNLDDFIAKAHAFTASPPSDALSLTRSNGDRLLYDPKRNIFAVVDKDGAPRTMFKPQAGKAYWDQQVARQSDDANHSDRSGGERRYGRRSSDSASSDDQG